MRTLLVLTLATSLSASASFCNKTDDSKKTSSSDDKSDKKKKSGDDDDDDKGSSACTTKFVDAAKKQKDNAFDFKCPADCDPKGASVWGTGWYTTDSAVCLAAIHSGAIKASKGGKVTVTSKKGLKTYLGSKANGVTSSDYGS
jgi:LCCL domain